jgi:hypothetical protein
MSGRSETNTYICYLPDHIIYFNKKKPVVFWDYSPSGPPTQILLYQETHLLQIKNLRDNNTKILLKHLSLILFINICRVCRNILTRWIILNVNKTKIEINLLTPIDVKMRYKLHSHMSCTFWQILLACTEKCTLFMQDYLWQRKEPWEQNY